MTRRFFRPTALLALALCAGAPLAQEVDDVLQPPAAAAGAVVVETNLPGGMLSVGDEPLGPAGMSPFVLAPGRYRLTLHEAEPEAWRPRRAEAEVEVRAGETVTVRLDVPTRYRIESFPYGAVVTVEGEGGVRRLGETPLDYESPRPLEGTLVVEKAGHAAAEQAAGAAADNRYRFVLRPLDYEAGTAEVALGQPGPPNYWIDVAAVGLALGAGALAVHYKFKGDDEYAEYARSGDPQQRDDFERYDTYSAIALGAMQVGIGVFAVRLVLR
jgi:hypothetical protein